MAYQFPLSNVINISIASVQPGVGAYNTSNIGLFSRETVSYPTFGTAGYKLYTSPTQVGIDFGTSSNTYAMANAIFGQQPNILANQGYLCIIPFLTNAQTAQQTVTIPLSSAGLPPASGSFEFTWGGHSTAAINYNNVSQTSIQSIIQAATGMTSFTVSNVTTFTGGTILSGFTVTFVGQSGAVTLATISADSLADSSSNAITPTVATTVIGSAAETLDQAILRTENLVQYFAVAAAEITPQAVLLLAAAEIQALNKILVDVTYTAADVQSGGRCVLIQQASYTQTRCLFYDDVLATSLVYLGAYLGLGFSTNFTGSNTTQTMHLKTLTGVSPDPNITTALFASAQSAGADTYVSLQGVPKNFCSGANDFFDNQYNLQWLAGALQVAGFNYLATTNTKIPQTEQGMTGLKGAYRQVLEQAATNQFLAPGSWTSSTTFGNVSNLVSNIAQVGYYIYSQPVAQQSQTARVARQAPLVQIAIKYAGAIQSSTAIVYVNQ
jgi:hypothetical protein